MIFNFKPTNINIYREFPVQPGEISLIFENDDDADVYIYRRIIIRDSELLPVAEARLTMPSDWYDLEDDSMILLEIGDQFTASLVMDSQNVNRLEARKEYHALVQTSKDGKFAWTDKMLASIDAFSNWNESSGAEILAEIANMLPVSFVEVPLHVRGLVPGEHVELCMDFGTSFSACAIAINPARSGQLACFKNTDEPRSIYYTQFADSNDNLKNIVPTAMVLKKIHAGGDAEWLCGYEAQNWARKHPDRGAFLVNIKSLLSNIDNRKNYRDENGQGREFSNGEIIHAYLKFLVERSKRYFGINFKNIHITTPVGYSQVQHDAFVHILKDLGFTRINNKLDEARAPLYHFLANRVEKVWNGEEDPNARRKGDKALSYLIIDCGGGSTDATLLRDIDMMRPVGREGAGIIMKSRDPERGGNPKFGGQDLTNLLFHYVKMRISQKAFPRLFNRLDPALEVSKDYLIDNLIPQQMEELFWELYSRETSGMDGIQPKDAEIPVLQHKLAYSLFDDISKKVEQILPTDEEHNELADRETWDKINRNKSIIGQLAELLKVRIYSYNAPRAINLLDLAEAPDEESDEDSNVEFWLRDPAGELQKVPAEDIRDGLVFNTYELDKLFRPIIFREMSRILRGLNVKTDLINQDALFNVRFVGQSTNIPIFFEAVAFFVPRAMIELENNTYKAFNTSRFQPMPAEEKKISCVTGAASFLKHIADGCLKNDDFVASSKVLHNFCRLGGNGKIRTAGVYNANREKADYLIARDTPMSVAKGAIVRNLASNMEESFGTSYDETLSHAGFINFRQEDMDRPLTDEEKQAVENEWGELFHNLGADDNDPAVLIEVRYLEEGAAKRYEFRPYYYDQNQGKYFTTKEPLPLNTIGAEDAF